jgi:hypothetical protein
MKRVVFIAFALFGLFALGGSSWPLSSSIAAPSRESAVVEFTRTVKLHGALLRGVYTIVHDEEKMARGEPCTYVYRDRKMDERKLVVSFHCIHVERERATAFGATIPQHGPYEVPEITEIQFAGSTAGHKVP